MQGPAGTHTAWPHSPSLCFPALIDPSSQDTRCSSLGEKCLLCFLPGHFSMALKPARDACCMFLPCHEMKFLFLANRLLDRKLFSWPDLPRVCSSPSQEKKLVRRNSTLEAGNLRTRYVRLGGLYTAQGHKSRWPIGAGIQAEPACQMVHLHAMLPPPRELCHLLTHIKGP